MAATEENSALFPIFILTIMALPLVPYTIIKLCRAVTTKATSINCQCSVCFRSGKYRKSMFKRVSNFSTYSNLTLVLLWVIMAVLVYYIKHISQEGSFCWDGRPVTDRPPSVTEHVQFSVSFPA
ncbi:unnamed protein product [Ilex paraguariensis]|uniref:Uncharacterized protein n=1 Tax=Ilex paraguariensis TaxID=185542 RepID=A0ABC8TJ60_9AQUA